jgi:large subunit ribosomal protein L21
MYAVVRTGGKQYKVAKDSVLKVESLLGEVGSKLDRAVLMLGGD